MRIHVLLLALLLVVVASVASAATPQFQEILPDQFPNAVGAGWGDYDGDGYADLYVAGTVEGDASLWHGPYLYHNNQDLTFTDVSTSVGFDPTTVFEQDGVAWGDYDNDGDLDLLVGSGAGYPMLYRWDGSAFTEVGGAAGFRVSFSAGRGVCWADYDGDNLLDAFCGNIFGPNYLMHSNGDGTFSEVSSAAGLMSDAGESGSWGDYNNDGTPDLIIARMDQPTLLYRNNGDGTFTDVSDTSGIDSFVDGFSAVWGDYDNDGWLDCYVTSASYFVPQTRRDALFHNEQDGTFTNVSLTAGMSTDVFVGVGAAWADYDNDGWLDLLVGNMGQEPFLYHNDGDGTFTDVAASSGLAGIRVSGAISWADIDLDGCLDVMQAVWDAPSRLFHNLGAPGNWLRVRAVTRGLGGLADATAPIREAVGARVEVNLDNDDTFPPGRTLTRLIDGGSGYCEQNEQVAHFGLGASGVVAVRVTFPTGDVLVRTDVATDQQVLFDGVRGLLGRVDGVVTDEGTDDPIAGAAVAIGGVSAETGGDGSYSLAYVPEGSYTATASAVGYRDAEVPDVTVVPEATVVVNFALERAYGTIAGVVRDAATAEPLAGATVTCDERTQVTAADGLFSFDGLWTESEYTVLVSAPSYQAATYTDLTVTDGGTTSLTVELIPLPGSIAGHVSDGGATPAPPVAGATVSCSGRSTTTNATGDYLLEEVPAGADLTLTVAAEWFETATVSGLTLAPEQTLTVNVEMTPLFGGLTGVVRDAVTHAGIRGAVVTCQGQSATTGSSGAYLLEGLRASVANSVTVTSPTHLPGTFTGITIGVGAPTTLDLVLTAQASGSVSGVVSDAETQQPVEGATVNCGVASAVTDADGAYLLEDIPAGEQRIGARAPGYCWASDAGVMVADGQDTTHNITLTPLPEQGPSFTPITGLPVASGAAWGDYDGDGYADMFVAGSRGVPWNYALLHNEHDLTFRNVSSEVGLPAGSDMYYGVAWGDYDNDGWLDALLSADMSAADKLFRNDAGHFTDVAEAAGLPYVNRPGRSVAWCDYNRDNWLDVFVCYVNWPGYDTPGRLFRSNGDGTFADVTADAGFSGEAYPLYASAVAWGDYDGDSWPDLAMTRFNLPPKLYRNNGDGTLSEVTSAAGIPGDADSATGVAWGDYDNDGWLDLYMGGSAGDRLLHNEHDGTFTMVSSAAGISAVESLPLAWADCDNDGYLDVYAGPLDGSAAFYHNNGDGRFTNIAAALGLPPVGASCSADWADADLDGRLDLWIGGTSGSALLHNTTPSGNWLRVRALTDRNGDAAFSTTGEVRDAIGARVELSVDDDPNFPPYRTLVRTIDGGSGFCGQNEPIAQFGVPTPGPVAVRVLFPNGSVVVHRHVSTGREITIKDARPDRVPAFDDIPLDYWANTSITACVAAGIVQGYWDDTYRPEEEVTRGQMAVFIARALAGGDDEVHVPTGVAEPSFTDVPESHWAYRYVEYIAAEGVVEGYWDGSYHPDAAVTRDQMAVYVSRAVVEPHGDEGLASWLPPVSPHFIDVPTDHWAYRYVEYARAAGIVQGYWDGSYRPDNVVTRDQMAVYVARAFELP